MSVEAEERTGVQAAPWTRVLIILSAVIPLWAAFITLMSGEFIPPVVIFGVLFLATAVVLQTREGKSGPVMAIVVSVALLLGGAPIVLEALPHPESALDFILSLIQVTIPLAVIVAAVGALRRWAAPAVKIVVAATAGVVVLGSLASIAAAFSLEDDAALSGDSRVIAEDVEFAPTTVRAGSGSVAVFVANNDPIRHTFTIEELNVDLELPASTDRRIEFTAAPGTYEFVCAVSGHEDMTGTLVVEG